MRIYMKMNFGLFLLLVLVYLGSYVVNIIRFTQCDFEAPYKGEIIHLVGIIIPGASLVTVWIDAD